MRVLLLPTALAALAGCQASPPDPRGVARNETLLTLSASGRADTRPDEARLQLGVQSIAPTGGEASQLNRGKMEQVTGALARLGVRADDLQTRNLSLDRINYGQDRGRFRAHNIVEVKLRDMSKVGEAVAAVTDAGANLLSGPDLRVSDRESSSRSAYAAAYRAARARAEAYAQAAELKVLRVLSITDGGGSGIHESYPAYADASMETSAPPPPARPSAPFSAGMNSSEVRVQVSFALGR